MRFPSLTAPLLLIATVLLLSWSLAGGHSAEHPTLPPAAVDLPKAEAGAMRTAVVGGGCFWCIEGVFAELAGVTEVVSGYAGGTAETATYDKSHGSAHAEAVRITYDPSRITFGDLMRVLFTAGDPTSANGQMPDFGPQYRMVVFYATADEQRVAEAYIKQLSDAQLFAKPIVVTVEPMPHGFFKAEEYHQRFAAKHPDNAYVCRWSKPKIDRIRAAFPELVKPAPPGR